MPHFCFFISHQIFLLQIIIHILFAERLLNVHDVLDPSVGSTCVAQSALRTNTRCDQLMLSTGIWASTSRAVQPWIKFFLPEETFVTRIEVILSAFNMERCSQWTFLYSDGSSVQVSDCLMETFIEDFFEK